MVLRRDHIHVDDVVSALLDAQEYRGRGMNIGTGTETSTRDLFVLSHAAQSTVSPTIQPEVHDLVRRTYFLPRAREKLDGAKVSLHEGIAQTIAWYKEHR
jgi:nucleoside-diphosphate-sugar epimerase